MLWPSVSPLSTKLIDETIKYMDEMIDEDH